MKHWTTSLTGLACCAVLVWAQSSGTESTLTFEVVSVKPNTTLDTFMSINGAPGGQLNGTNVTLRALIGLAYDVRDYQILDAPGWAGTERYDVLAKPSAGEAGSEQASGFSEAQSARLRQRTRAMLADRFGLKVHIEQKESSVYALRIAKGGPKLEETKSDVGPQISSNNRRVTCKKVTMKRFAEVLLASRVERWVIDETGLTGEYDFQLVFGPDVGAGKESADSTDPPFLTAMQEQLGLRLVPTKGPAPFLVVEQAARPAAN